MKILKLLLSFMFLTAARFGFAQTKQCECLANPGIPQDTTFCNARYLRDSSMLYYQFNCDSIWLTLENKTGQHFIFSMPIKYYSYTDTLGFQFVQEFNRSILFRTACRENGSCNFLIVEKETGYIIHQFGQLIYDHTIDSPFTHPFILYFQGGTLWTIILYYIDSDKKYTIAVDGKQFNGSVPSYEIDNIKVKNHQLTFTQPYRHKGKWTKKTIHVDLKEYAP